MNSGDPLHLQYRTTNGVTVVGFNTPYLQAEADVEKVGAELFDLVDSQKLTKLVLSFQGVRFVSSSMLAQLVQLHKKLHKSGGKLRLCALSPTLADLVHTTHLDKLFEVVPDEASALEKF